MVLRRYDAMALVLDRERRPPLSAAACRVLLPVPMARRRMATVVRRQAILATGRAGQPGVRFTVCIRGAERGQRQAALLALRQRGEAV
jgi:hypothetical protein